MPLHLPSYFEDFLRDIRPTKTQRSHMAAGHRVLRQRLKDDPDLGPGIVGMFLQGSYKRFTAVRPKDQSRPDVDLIVVTRMKEAEYAMPSVAMDRFKPFLEKWYGGKFEPQGRSFGITLTNVAMDLVITAAPSEAEEGIYASLSELDATEDEDAEEDEQEERLLKSAADSLPQWKIDPLRIPDREQGHWQDTDPLAQIDWTTEKNSKCNGHYINVVKALKWWRLEHADYLPKRPKSYPLEHTLGDCCPDKIGSIAEGVVLTLEAFVGKFKADVDAHRTPVLLDRGVAQDVMARIEPGDFAAFYNAVVSAARTARRAFDAPDAQKAVPEWQKLFGTKFKNAPPEGGGGGKGFTPREDGSGRVGPTRFA